MKKTFTILIAAIAAILMMAQPMKVWADSQPLNNSDIVSSVNLGGNQTTGYQSNTLTDANSNTWNTYSNVGYHSKATNDKYFVQIKKYASSTAYYIQVPELGTKITSITMTVSNTSKPMDGGENSATLFFSSSSSTSATGNGVASGTGASSVTIDCSSLNLNTGYITASAGVRIWDVVVTYTASGSTPTITLTEGEPGFTLGTVEAGVELSRTFTVAQENLTAAISLSTTVGSLSQSNVAQGAAVTTVTWTYTPTAGEISGTITASSTGAESKTITIDGTAAAFYDVTFDAGDGTFEGNAEFPDESGNHVVAGSHTLPSATPAEGYQFDGWIATGIDEPVTGSFDITGNIDFTASYSEYTGPKVTYNFGATGNNQATYFYTDAQHNTHAAINTNYSTLYYANGDVECVFTMGGEPTNSKFSSGYFFLGTTNAYMEFPTYDFDVERIEVVGRSGASGKVTQNIYVGNEAVSTQTTGATGTNTYTIASGYQASGTVYKLKVTNAYSTQITTINIYEKKAGTVSAPTLPAAANFTVSKQIEITGIEEGASVYYTLDDTAPTTSSTPYTAPFTITNTTKVRAIAVKGGVSSTEATATYTRVYVITLTQSAGGTISSNVNQAAAGATITLTATPNVGYTFGSWSVLPTVTINDNSFSMPAADVTVNATFTALSNNSTISFSINSKVEMTATIYGGSIDLTKFVANPTTEGYNFGGWSTTDGGSAMANQMSYVPSGDVTLYPVFSTPSTDDYTLVTSTDQLVAGNLVVIAAKGSTNMALSTTQNGNNRGASSHITKTAQPYTNITITENTSDVCELVLQEGSTSGTWAFYDAGYNGNELNGGYLYAASSSSNYLRTQENIDANASFTITITSNEATITAQGTNTHNLLRYNSSNEIFSCYDKNQNNVYLYTKPASTSKATRETVAATPNITEIAANVQVTVKNGGVVNLTGNNNGNEANLIVEDGGQLVTTNNVKATFQKSITGYTSNKDNYYLIAAPFAVTPSKVSGMLANEYDLYYFDQDHDAEEWRNYKTFVNGFSMYKASGYLYANSVSKTLEFAGTASKDQNTTKKLKKTAEKPFSGFNLVGNPLAVNITSLKVGESEISYYMLTSSGTFTATTATSTPIKVCEGFMVEATADDQTLNINTASKDSGDNNGEIIRLEVANSQYQDVAYVRFGGNMPLSKINHINDEAPMLYINNNDADYAVAVLNNRAEVKCLNVNFKAKTMGTYTISGKAENGNISYMHLIDRLTGADIDLLNDSYSFIGSKSDIAERFILRFEAKWNGADNEIFAFQNGNDIIVNGEGELQIFDVMGRNIMNTTINGVQIVNVKSQGVYIFKLNEKTQKIIVR